MHHFSSFLKISQYESERILKNEDKPKIKKFPECQNQSHNSKKDYSGYQFSINPSEGVVSGGGDAIIRPKIPISPQPNILWT